MLQTSMSDKKYSLAGPQLDGAYGAPRDPVIIVIFLLYGIPLSKKLISKLDVGASIL